MDRRRPTARRPYLFSLQSEVSWLRRVGFSLPFFLSLISCRHPPPDPLPGFPRLVLWAWERPEHLDYIVPRATGVAYLAGTIRFKKSDLQSNPRLQPLFLPPNTPLIAVVRLESPGHGLPPLKRLAHEILNLIQSHPVRALQIDFDARRSEQAFYRQLLERLHRDAPAQTLEITALVSWCEGNDWLRGLPVVDAVPMFFRMGLDPHATNEKLREPLCRLSLGISTDEFYRPISPRRRVFLFNPRPWTLADYRAVLSASKRWF